MKLVQLGSCGGENGKKSLLLVPTHNPIKVISLEHILGNNYYHILFVITQAIANQLCNWFCSCIPYIFFVYRLMSWASWAEGRCQRQCTPFHSTLGYNLLDNNHYYLVNVINRGGWGCSRMVAVVGGAIGHFSHTYIFSTESILHTTSPIVRGHKIR